MPRDVGINKNFQIKICSIREQRDAQSANQQWETTYTWSVYMQGGQLCVQPNYSILKFPQASRSSLWENCLWQTRGSVLHWAWHQSPLWGLAQFLQIYRSRWNINKDTKASIAYRRLVAVNVGNSAKVIFSSFFLLFNYRSAIPHTQAPTKISRWQKRKAAMLAWSLKQS